MPASGAEKLDCKVCPLAKGPIVPPIGTPEARPTSAGLIESFVEKFPSFKILAVVWLSS